MTSTGRAMRAHAGRDTAGTPSAQALDRHVARRMRERRLRLGLTVAQMADLIGVSYKQVQKYETGDSRIAASVLYLVAWALGVDANYFFEELDAPADAQVRQTAITRQQEMLLEVARCFSRIPSSQQEAVLSLARALAQGINESGERRPPPEADAIARTFTAIIEADEEQGGYVVTYPALPGLATQGETLDEARLMAEECLRGYLEALRDTARPLPDPDGVRTTDTTATIIELQIPAA